MSQGLGCAAYSEDSATFYRGWRSAPLTVGRVRLGG
ncbi:MAG: hypothetical protein QOG43_2954 [Actinomycetota bacterium]|nr:hypothetical protein [Actinomycetota bacterium]